MNASPLYSQGLAADPSALNALRYGAGSAAGKDDKTALKNLETELKRVIFGQDDAITEVSSAIRLSRSGLRAPDKPIAGRLIDKGLHDELTGTAYSIYVNQDSENGVMDVFMETK